MTPELSILIAAHHEGLIAHKTMLSIERALAKLSDVRFEIIITIDNGDDDTKTYFKNYRGLPVSIFEINDRDLAASRNFAIKKSKGKYIAIVDADDLVSEDWFKLSLEHLRQTKAYQVLHAQYSVNFGTQDIVWEKFDSRSLSEDATIMVWANRWDSAIVTQREVLEKYPYQPNKAGFGSEDWHFNSQTLADGIPHKVVPRTVLFVRRKDVSEMTIQSSSRRTVHYTELLSISSLKGKRDYAVSVNENHEQKRYNFLKVTNGQVQRAVKSTLKPLHRFAKMNLFYTKLVRPVLNKNRYVISSRFPAWLTQEWRDIHALEKTIFPSQTLLDSIPVYHSEMHDLGERFRDIMSQFSDEPDYIVFLPSLNRGGAELVALNFINSLKTNFPSWKVAVVATDDFEHPWVNLLPSGVSYVEFGKHTNGISYDQKLMLLARLIVQSKAQKLHIAQSALMFKFASLYKELLSNYTVYAFAFCEDEDNEGRIAGHIHSGLPYAYPVISMVFTDNQYVIDELVHEYAFDPKKFAVLYQPVTLDIQQPVVHKRNTLRILWASRVSKQKRPDILADIARKLNPKDFSIDMYGLMQDGYSPVDFKNIPALQYRGEFTLMNDIDLSEYDLFLYTSENDGVPNILIAATAAGLPVIAPKIGGIPELLGANSPMLIQDFDSTDEYISAIKSFYSYSSDERMDVTRKVQDTIVHRHSWDTFNRLVDSELA